MKNLFLILISVMLISVGLAQTTKTYYTCVMHPEIKMDKPGKCPKCGMTLVKKTSKVAVPKQTPPKTEEKSKPQQQPVQKEEQSKTGMNMEQPQTKEVYTCGMHPQVQEDKPGRCPICGMPLIKKEIKAPIQKSTEQKAETDQMEMDMQAHDHDATDDSSANNEVADEIGTTVNLQPGKTVVYHLYARDTIVNYTGKRKHAIAINGSIPAPTLTFTEGDTAEIYLHNMLKEETSLHWHGIILPNRFDGVPYLTTAPIYPGETHLYKFKVVQNGTYWYHSHSALQEQVGMYGALILNKREMPETQQTDMTIPMDHANMEMDSSDMQMSGHSNKMMNSTSNMPMDHSNMSMGKDSGMSMDDHSGMQMDNHSNMRMSKDSSSTGMDNNTSLKHYNVVLSEWADEKPTQTQRRLRTANDWFSIKKGSTQSYSEAIKEGYLKTKLVNEWKRMKAMDVSDDWYQRFLVNGKPETTEPQFKAGDKVMLHVVNAGASTYFWLTYGGGKITVVGNDGNDVVPVEVDRLIVGVAETYDVVVTIPDNMSYEFRATSEDRTGASSLWLGAGMKMPAPKLPRLKYFEGMKMMNAMMRTNGTMKDMGMNMSLQKMDMNSVMYPEITGGTGDTAASGNNNPEKQDAGEQHKDTMQGMDMKNMQHDNMNGMQNMNMSNMQHGNMGGMEGMDMSSSDIVTLNYNMLRSPVKTSLPDGLTKVLHFTLTGNMNRYVWSLDNKTVTESDRILISKGEKVRLILTNNSMMRHPMHLHGHDFRVLNQYGDYSPLKNVIDVMPMETDTIEFAANQSGNWFFHCHILFHMMAGMGRVFTYENSPVNPELPNTEQAYRKFKNHRDQNMKHLMVRASLQSNGSDGLAMLSSNRYALQETWHLGTSSNHGYESETYVGRYLGVNQWLYPYIGFDYHYKKEGGHDFKNIFGSDKRNMFGQLSNKENRRTVVVGVQYTLPWLVFADARVDGNGKFRFQLSREDVPITPRLRFNLMLNTDKEYTAGFRYIISKWFALSTHYDSDMGLGAGLTLTY